MKKNIIKNLREKKNSLLMAMDSLMNQAGEEQRALTSEETEKFDKLEEEVRALNATIERAEKDYMSGLSEGEKKEERKEREEKRAFEEYLRGHISAEELRDDGESGSGGNEGETSVDSNYTLNANGDVLPKYVAKKIIDTFKEKCNFFEWCSIFTAPGELAFPVYDESEGKITMDYAEEFSELTATSGKFVTKSLKGYLAAELVKISKSLINNTEFDLFGYVVNKAAEAAADWCEKEFLKGTENKITGLSGVEKVASTLSADSIIDLQDSVASAFQKNARWIMNKTTKNKIRKLKDGEGNYLLTRDYTADDGNWNLLGKPVYLTESEGIADDEIFYGDFSGLFIKIVEAANIEIYKELFAPQHAVGVAIWLEMDADVMEPQKIKKLKVGQ
ncbi:MAG: phage major capsid protein [Firmicutes bacterium]|nr:phage major capsid protein [Bacillota bacterium]